MYDLHSVLRFTYASGYRTTVYDYYGNVLIERGRSWRSFCEVTYAQDFLEIIVYPANKLRRRAKRKVNLQRSIATIRASANAQGKLEVYEIDCPDFYNEYLYFDAYHAPQGRKSRATGRPNGRPRKHPKAAVLVVNGQSVEVKYRSKVIKRYRVSGDIEQGIEQIKQKLSAEQSFQSFVCKDTTLGKVPTENFTQIENFMF